MLGVVRDAVTEAGEAFWSEFDPSFHLKGMLQPIILGIPFGEPQHEVELIISKTGLGFGFDTSIADIGIQLCDRIIPFISGAFCRLMTLGFEDHLGMTVELPIGGIVEGLFGGSGVPTIDPMSGDWAIELRGGLRWLDFEVGQMTGLVVAAGNPAFLDAHVQKLWEDPGASIDPNRIPIRTQQHYDDIVEHGGVLLTGRLLLPELLTDPVGLLSSLNLQVPDDVADMPDWVAAIADHLGRTDDPAAVQLFLPGFGEVFDFAYDAATEADRVAPIGSGEALADAFNEISQAAYMEGVFDGTLLSLPFGRAAVTVSDQKLSVEGELPLTGLETRIDLDVEPVLGTDGTVDMPPGRGHGHRRRGPRRRDAGRLRDTADHQPRRDRHVELPGRLPRLRPVVERSAAAPRRHRAGQPPLNRGPGRRCRLPPRHRAARRRRPARRRGPRLGR